MRFECIDLRAVGPFSGLSLSFERDEREKRDLTVIYGPNEAGKSSLLIAICDLLFGIPAATQQDFRHSKGDLRVAARISSETGALAFCRRKGTKNTLLDWAGSKALDESALAPFLGATDRAGFERMHGFSTESLRRGSEALLSSDAGEILMQAAGLPEANRLLADLRREMGDIYAPKASKPALNAALSAYRDSTAAAKKLATTSENAPELQREIERCKAAERESDQEIKAHEAELRKLQRISANKPDLARCSDLESQLAALSTIPELPDSAATDRVKAETDARIHSAEEERTRAELVEAQHELELTPDPAPVLARAADIEDLVRRQGAYANELRDIPNRQDERDDAQREATEHWARAQMPGSPDHSRAQACVDRKTPIDNLWQRSATAEAALTKAADDLKTAIASHCEAAEAFACHPPVPDTSRLAAAVANARASALPAALRSAIGDQQIRARKAADLLRALPGAPADAATLRGLSPPLPETRQRFARQWSDAEAALRQAGADLTSAERQRAEAEAETLRPLAQPLKSSDDLTGARAARSSLWARMRSFWLGKITAQEAQSGVGQPLDVALDGSIVDADTIADERFENAAALAERQACQRRLADAEQRLGAARQARDTAQTGFDACREEWHARWPAGFDLLPPAEMEAWLNQRQSALDAADEAHAKADEVDATNARIIRAKSEISASLADLGEPPATAVESLDTLILRADETLKSAETAKREGQKRKDAVETARKLLGAAETEHQTQQNRTREREDERQGLFAQLLLPPEWSTDQAHKAVGELAQVAAQLAHAQSLTDRIGKMQRNTSAFEADARALAAPLALGGPDTSPASLAGLLTQGLTQARADAARRAQLEQTIRKCKSGAADARRQGDLTHAELRRLQLQAGCDNPAELPRIEESSRRKQDLRRDLGAARKALLDRNHIGMGEIQAEAQPYQADSMAAAIELIEQQLGKVRGRRDEVRGELSKAQHELDRLAGSVDLATSIQAKADCLAAVRARAERYARLSIMADLVQAGIDAFRAGHETPILAAARRHFQSITCGEFDGLESAFDDNDRPVLHALRSNGERLAASQLSDGTRDQLFLALRIAAAREAPPMPLILDDVLMTFDDQRAAATMTELADLGRRCQVLLLTHHDRTVELARNAGIRIVTLGGAERAAARPA